MRLTNQTQLTNEVHMLPKQQYTANGQTVDCYRTWDPESSNASCVFENEEFDGVFADGADSWQDAVEQMTAYAARNGTVLIEMGVV